MHSQRLRETALKPWLVAEKTGKILCAHCNCMAGLGETCTHVSALLFWIETTSRIRDSQTVTQAAAYWKLPPSLRDVHYLPTNEIDFTSAKTKKKRLDSLVCDNTATTPSKRQAKEVPSPTAGELSTLFQQLSLAGSKAAVLRVVPEICKQFKPTSLSETFPCVLTSLYDPEKLTLDFSELLKKCEEVKLTVTPEQAKSVERATKSQASSKLWFRFRSGRITASKMKRVCRSNPDLPSQSLIKSICYPESVSFSVDATKWGCKHEDTARKEYSEKMAESHENFTIHDSGFVIHPDYPHIGATPDAMVSCDCCGCGVVEIKCPYCARDSTIDDMTAGGVKTCLEKEGEYVFLKKDHEHMYQIQTQISVCNAEFADFVLWTEKDLHIERIEEDPSMWDLMVASSKEFFDKAVLPELVGKFYSRENVQMPALCAVQVPCDKNSESADDDRSQTYCYCGEPEDHDDMIMCDDENCKIVWYHLVCLKMKRVPKGKWLCPNCRKLSKKKYQPRKTNK